MNWKLVKISLLPLVSELESAIICCDVAKIHVICDKIKSEYSSSDLNLCGTEDLL